MTDAVSQRFATVRQRVYRAIPDDPTNGPPNDPLDPSFAAQTDQNRWNLRGQSTLYLARDARALSAEAARYADPRALDPLVVALARPRRIWAVTAAIDRVLDLRQAEVCAALGLPDPPYGFMRDRRRCQEIATWLRTQTETRAILAPSMALLDQPEHWVMALFVERLPTFPEPFLVDPERLGILPRPSRT